MKKNIYPSEIIRIQSEAIKLLEKENQQLKEEIRKLTNSKYDSIELIKDLACYDKDTNAYCNSIKYYDVHKIIDSIEGKYYE